MRVKLERDDLSLLIVAGSILLVATLIGAFVAPVTSGGMGSTPSSYSSAKRGAKAAYLVLQDLGYHEDRWLATPLELPEEAKGTVLIFADPEISAAIDEKLAIKDFIRHGGRVIATGESAATLLGLEYSPFEASEDESEEFSATAAGPISQGAAKVSFDADVRYTGANPENLVYYGDTEGGVVVHAHLGDGDFTWWANAFPLTNDGIAKSSNLTLLLNSIGKPGDTTVLWDEYFHGERTGLWSYLRKTPLLWVLLQAVILVLAVILTYSRRSGPVVKVGVPSRLSPIEFVETVGDLYARKHAAASALEAALRRFKGLLARSLGISSEAPLEAFQPRIADLGTDSKGLTELLAKCETAIKSGITNEKETLKLVQDLHRYTLRLRLAG